MTRGWERRIGCFWVAALVFASAGALLPAGSTASKPRVEFLRRVSGVSPFPGPCGRNPLVFVNNSEAEPTIAVKPGHPRRLTVAWMQDGLRSNVVATSRNGGRSWRRALVPGLTVCTGGTQEIAADPWLSFGRGGNLYLGSAAGQFAAGGNLMTGIVVSRSQTSGRSWTKPRYVQPPTDIAPGLFWDKPALVADPRRRGRVYVSFDQNSENEVAIGSSFSSRTKNGGRTWSHRSRMFNPGTVSAWPASNIPLLLPDGTLVNIGVLYGIERPRLHYYAQRSTDRGRNWSGRLELGSAPNVMPTHPSGAQVSSQPIPSATVARDGTIYVTWAKISLNGTSVIRIVRSRDGGRSFSRPRAVTRVKGQAFLPIVAVAGDGTVGVSYYRTGRNGPGSQRWKTWATLSASSDGRRRWRRSRLARPFDMLRAQEVPSVPGVYFVGDYEGLAGLPHGFVAAFALGRPRAKVGPSDIFVARVRTDR